MEKRVKHRTGTLGGLLFGYLVRTGLACLAVAAVWFGTILLLIQVGFILPAYSGSDATLQAMELLPAMSADHFDPDALPELCRWVLLDGASPGQTAQAADVLATNMTQAQLSLALALGTTPINTQFYRDVRMIDGTLCRLQYDFSIPYVDPALRGVLPDFQLTWTALLLLLLAGVIAWSTRRTGRLLRAETARLTDACRLLAGGDLSGQGLGHSAVREFDQTLRTMETLRDGLADSLKAQWAMEQQRSRQIAALAHDLKTPLAIIQGNAELLLEDALPEPQRQTVEAILRGAGRAGQYLSALREVAAAQHSPRAPAAGGRGRLCREVGRHRAGPVCAPRCALCLPQPLCPRHSADAAGAGFPPRGGKSAGQRGPIFPRRYRNHTDLPPGRAFCAVFGAGRGTRVPAGNPAAGRTAVCDRRRRPGGRTSGAGSLVCPPGRGGAWRQSDAGQPRRRRCAGCSVSAHGPTLPQPADGAGRFR